MTKENLLPLIQILLTLLCTKKILLTLVLKIEYPKIIRRNIFYIIIIPIFIKI